MTLAPTSSAKPLFYTNPIPLDTQAHKTAGIRENLGLGFASGAHAVPANMIEFAQLCHTYPIVFAPDESATPIVVMGLREGENLFVTPKGEWAEAGSYIPSYIRRYPFILAEITGTQQMTLCIEDTPAVLDSKSAMKLLDASGKPTAMTNNALEFCKSFHAATLQTREFCAALIKHNLLVPREAEIPVAKGQAIRFGGFRILDEAKWAALDDKTLADFHRRGFLAAGYAALFSAGQWARLSRLYATRTGQKAA